MLNELYEKNLQHQIGKTALINAEIKFIDYLETLSWEATHKHTLPEYRFVAIDGIYEYIIYLDSIHIYKDDVFLFIIETTNAKTYRKLTELINVLQGD